MSLRPTSPSAYLATLAFMLLLWSTLTVAATYPLEIIDLKGRSADEVIPMIKPFAGDDGVVTGMHYQLFIRAAPERMNEIHRILKEIDRPPRRLMIHVTQDAAGVRRDQQIGIGGDVRYRKGERPDVRIGVGGYSGSTRSDTDIQQSIQTLEGEPAFIAEGTAYPVPNAGAVIHRGNIYYEQHIEYRETASGFYVLPRVNGDQVTLQISPQMERPGHRPGTFDIHWADTAVTGRVGEWIAIGGTNNESRHEDSGIGMRGTTSEQNRRDLAVRVEVLD